MTFTQFRGHMVFILLGLFILASAPVWCLPADGVTPLNDREYVRAVHLLFQNAKTNIRVMAYQAFFYEEFPDSDSNGFIVDLIDARKRGVEVWFFLETSNWDQNLERQNRDYARRLEEGGIKVLWDHREITSHQKVIIVDDYATIISSNNWSHFSLWMNYEVAALVWSRPVAHDFSEYLNDLLKQAGHEPLPKTEASKHITAEETGHVMLPAEDVLSANNRDYFPMISKAFREAGEHIRVLQRSANYSTMMPGYARDKQIVEGEEISQVNTLLKDMIDADNRGVDVQVILEGEVRKRASTGEWKVTRDNEDFAMRLLGGGVPVWYDSLTTQTHAKMVIVDDLTVVGSTNWTLNALERGNEASVMIRSAEVARHYLDYFDERKREGVKVIPGMTLDGLRVKMEEEYEKNPGLAPQRD